MFNKAMPLLTEELFSLFETTGNRLKYEDVYFKRRKFLSVFGISTYLWNRRSDAAKLEEILHEICNEECWALPAHVNRRENPDWRNTVDLFAAETAQALAEIVTLVGNISVDLKENIHAEIERRVLLPFEQHSQGWECCDHNWNAVCCGSIGSAAIYLLAGKDEERLKKMLQRICHSLTFYLNGFREDGACMEGIGYFTYGMTYFAGFAEQLFRYSNGKINLFANDKVRKIAEYQQKMYFSCGQTVSFSDGEMEARFRMGLTCFLAEQYDTVRLPNPAYAADFETDPCYRFMGLLRDVLWTKESAETVLSEEKENRDTNVNSMEPPLCTPRHDILPHAQWSICESKNGVGFAMKGGNNGEPHNHNDVGSFLYLAGGEQLICDLGAGEYTAEYFGEGRYNILCNSSEGHSVPIINGGFQQAGAQYQASSFEADGKGRTRIEFSDVYAEGTVDELIREAEVSLEDGRVIVTDEWRLRELLTEEGSSNRKNNTVYFTENLVTKGTVIVQGNIVHIRGKHTSCQVEIEGKVGKLRVLDKLHFDHEGKQETVRLIQWEVEPGQVLQAGEKGVSVYGISKYTIRLAGTEFEKGHTGFF